MRLTSLISPTRTSDRMGRLLRRQRELLEPEPRPSRIRGRTAVTVAVVAVTAVAAGTGAYLWWRRHREAEDARLLETEPTRSEPAPPVSAEWPPAGAGPAAGDGSWPQAEERGEAPRAASAQHEPVATDAAADAAGFGRPLAREAQRRWSKSRARAAARNEAAERTSRRTGGSADAD